MQRKTERQLHMQEKCGSPAGSGSICHAAEAAWFFAYHHQLCPKGKALLEFS
jgi:hypothetical protein